MTGPRFLTVVALALLAFSLALPIGASEDFPRVGVRGTELRHLSIFGVAFTNGLRYVFAPAPSHAE